MYSSPGETPVLYGLVTWCVVSGDMELPACLQTNSGVKTGCLCLGEGPLSLFPRHSVEMGTFADSGSKRGAVAVQRTRVTSIGVSRDGC